MERERKVRDQLRAGNEEENKYDPVKLSATHTQRSDCTGGRSIPDGTIKQPNERQRPSNRRVAAQTAPAEDEVQGKGSPCYQSGEQNKHSSADIIRQLQEENLLEYSKGREVG